MTASRGPSTRPETPRPGQVSTRPEPPSAAALVETSDDAIIVRAPDGTILSWNDGAARLFGYGAADAIGRPLDFFHTPAHEPHCIQDSQVLTAATLPPHESRRVTKDGRVLDVLVSMSTIRDAAGAAIAASVIIHDISPIKNAERAARENAERRYHETFEHPGVGMTRVGFDGTLLDANQKFCDLLGYRKDELIGKSIRDLTHPDDFGPGARFRDQLANGETGSSVTEKRYIRKDGTAMWARRTMTAASDETGAPRHVIVVIEDISERKVAEGTVISERALLRAVVDAIPERIYVKDREGRFLLQNAANVKAHGAGSHEELLGKTVYDIFPHETASRIEEEDRSIIESGESVLERERALPGKGETRWISSSKVPLPDADGKVIAIVGINRDITDSKHMEKELQEHMERFEIAGRATNDVIWDWNLATNALWWNDSFCKLFGYSEKDIEPGVESWYNRIHAADRDRVVDGIHRVIDTGENFWSDEYRFLRADGRHATIFDRAYVMRDADGKPVRLIGAMMDITERNTFARRREMELAVTGILAESNSVDEAMPRLLHTMCAAMGWVYGSRWAIGPDGDEIYRAEYWADRDPQFDPADHVLWLRQSRTRGQSGHFKRRAWEERKPTWITDMRKQVNFRRRPSAEKLGWLSGVAFPIAAEGRVIGVMEFFGREVREPDEMLLQMTVSVGSQIGQFIQRKEAEAALKLSEETLRATFSQASVGIIVTSLEHKFLEINETYAEIIGYSRQELMSGMTVMDVDMATESADATLDSRRKLVKGEIDNASREKRLRRKDGTAVWVMSATSVVRDGAGEPRHFVSVIQDISLQKLSEERLVHLAHYDVLTGLPNRALFTERVRESLAHARANKWITGIMFIDVDRFKTINDTLGHGEGDKLLKQISERLLRSVRRGDTVGRLGGDEFAVVLANMAVGQDAGMVAQKIVTSFEAPFELGGNDIYVSSSIGIALYPEDATDQDTLVRNADAAMYEAKRQGRNGYQFYRPDMNAQSLELLGFENMLRRALERSEFVVHYQPKAGVRSGKVTGFEALLRWNHPERGLVSPLEFIPLLEETGLVVPVGEWVLETACSQLRAWHRPGQPALPVSINLSARQFVSRSLGANIRRTLEKHGIDPALIELEITESSLMINTEEANRTLEALKLLGVALSIDDFGTGYSSLAYLKRFPIDTVKIDRSFVSDITVDEDDAAITRAIISMSHSLGLKVVAEGVETQAQLSFLADYGCDQHQGFLLAPPMPAEECAKWLAERAGER
jgi:diguanylate cyclase (GGDEF)-like protein/PAS domain S-box-containing protein